MNAISSYIVRITVSCVEGVKTAEIVDRARRSASIESFKHRSYVAGNDEFYSSKKAVHALRTFGPDTSTVVDARPGRVQ